MHGKNQSAPNQVLLFVERAPEHEVALRIEEEEELIRSLAELLLQAAVEVRGKAASEGKGQGNER